MGMNLQCVLITPQTQHDVGGGFHAHLACGETRRWTLKRVAACAPVSTASKPRQAEALSFDQNPQVQERLLWEMVVTRRFDRFASSVDQLGVTTEEFRSLGIDFVSHQKVLDTSTPIGKAMFTVIAAMAEFERDVIRERLVVGLHHARQHGAKSGRRVRRSRAVFPRDEISDVRRQGLP